jgi:hypothetical protein
LIKVSIITQGGNGTPFAFTPLITNLDFEERGREFMKKITLIALLSITALSPLLSGCGCDDAQEARDALYDVNDAVASAFRNPIAWPNMCEIIREKAADYPTSYAKATEYRNKLCKSPDDREAREKCALARTFVKGVEHLKEKTDELCKLVDKLPIDSKTNEVDLLNHNFTAINMGAEQAIAIYSSELITGGTQMMQKGCSKKESFVIRGPKSAFFIVPTSTNGDPREYNGNSSRQDDLYGIPAGTEERSAGDARS